METKSNTFQIRKLKKEDLDEVMNIWLSSNLDAHSFISADYWKSNAEMVKEAIAAAEVYVSEDKDSIILGFIGIVPDDYVAGLFVRRSHRSLGIGKSLIHYCQSIHQKLALKVFTKNSRAIQFYKGKGFKIQEETFDPTTNEKEYSMLWKNI
ncbi:acetyltransferase, GNAT family [Piromyces finnis]|uniref:Acetyltransferase, GNAT family n=1 Tax=Piromyces finnis TaxID=1754191 RepID=A0A1Y1VP00_9FUNG|nr:acetyltransferase, GNAT family [Piromyces finnis]|eukprot:ORX61138.1 acetyltransferase, GNAT family [Piromyces finnis]